MLDFECNEQLRAVLVQELRELGIKIPKIGKSVIAKPQQEKMDSGTVFGCPLGSLPTTTVDTDGLQVQIPRFLCTALNYLRQHFHVEGLFRKAGSITRQRDLKRNLENGGSVCNAEAQDVACLVKQFLRQLPEPLIVRRLHDTFVGIRESSGDVIIQCKVLQLVCLLLPIAHLHALRYLMLFFSELERQSQVNKMTVSNLAVVLTPNVFVSNCEPSHNDKQRCLLQKQMGSIQFMIANAEHIGRVPDMLVDRLCLQASMNPLIIVEDSHIDKSLAATSGRKKHDKKRHSINGVFNELRRMVRPVRHTSESVIGSPNVHVSPASPPSSSKRKHDDEAAPLSSSKKRALMQASCLNVPIPPQPRFDSPDPVSREDAMSFTPDDGLGIEAKRKSGRLRIFAKGYLRRRSSLGRTPKICKRSTSKESVISAVMGKKDARTGHQLSADDVYSKMSVVDETNSPACYFTRACHRERAAALVVPVAVSVLQERSINLSPTAKEGDKMVFDGQLANDFDITMNLQPQVKLHRMPSSATKACSVRRTRSKSHTDSNDENDDGRAGTERDDDAKTPPTYHFRRPANGGSTLRRGRPNTVRSGLPVPTNGDSSVAKSSKTHLMPCDSPCPLLVAIDQPIPIDSLELGVSQMDHTVPSTLPPNGDHINANATSARSKSRRSVSLSDIFQSGGRSLVTPDLNLSISCEQFFGCDAVAGDNGEVFLPDTERSCSVESGVHWKSAAIVLQDIRSLDNIEIEPQGRPSLIRLKKEKAGMVSMSVKMYNDAIARKVTETASELAGDRSLRISSPVRIPTIFVDPKLPSQGRSSTKSAPSSNGSNRRKTTSSQKPKIREAKNSSTPSTCGSLIGNGGGRSRRRLISQSSCQSPNLTTFTRRTSPRVGNTTVTVSQRKSAVRRSPRFVHLSDDSSSSTIKVKAASDAYRRRAIRGQVKRRSTVL